MPDDLTLMVNTTTYSKKGLLKSGGTPVASAEEEARSRINNITNNNNKVRVKIWK
jgi:hypothetical protein